MCTYIYIYIHIYIHVYNCICICTVYNSEPWGRYTDYRSPRRPPPASPSGADLLWAPLWTARQTPAMVWEDDDPRATARDIYRVH